jgi:hypothetical protein
LAAVFGRDEIADMTSMLRASQLGAAAATRAVPEP